MDLKQLRYFSTVAQFQNVSKAAQILHVSQSSLSKQIAKLEAELGVSLFDRNGKNIRLNTAGMRFNEYCTLLLKDQQAVENDIKFISRSEGVNIRIGACSMPDSFIDCMVAFREKYPDTKYMITTQIEEEHLDINEYDVLIYPDEYRFQNLKGYPFFMERYLYAISKEDPTSDAPAFSLESLKEKTLVFIQPRNQLSDFSFRICSALSIDAASIFFTDSRETHRRMISSGMASGFVPQSESGSYQADPAIRLLPVLNTRFHRPMKICFLRDKYLNEHARLFRSFVMEHFQLA